MLRRPPIKESRNNTRKIKNSTLAIPAALAAIPPNPNIPATIAMTRKIIVQRNIGFAFKSDTDKLTLLVSHKLCQLSIFLSGFITFTTGYLPLRF